MEAELSYIKHGEIYVGVNNKKYRLTEGDMAIFNSGDIHFYESTDIPSKFITLVFNAEFIDLPSKWPPKGNFQSPFVSKDKIENSELIQIKDILEGILD